jgi:hypothetical protein
MTGIGTVIGQMEFWCHSQFTIASSSIESLIFRHKIISISVEVAGLKATHQMHTRQQEQVTSSVQSASTASSLAALQIPSGMDPEKLL